MLILKILLFSLTLCLSLEQKATPCPDIFTYEPRNNQANRWYGRLLLNTTEELFGIRIHIDLDSPAKFLGNWFGETSTTENKRFLIKNSDYVLQPGQKPLSIRFYIEYEPNSDNVPSLQKILLNGLDVCRPALNQNEYESTPRLYISKPGIDVPQYGIGSAVNIISKNRSVSGSSSSCIKIGNTTKCVQSYD